MADDALFTIAGQEFKVTSPERVLYPATGTTKLDVIGYYAEASTAMLPHLAGRPATRKRWPEGVERTSFVVKDLEAGAPGWLTRGPAVRWPHLINGPFREQIPGPHRASPSPVGIHRERRHGVHRYSSAAPKPGAPDWSGSPAATGGIR